MEYNAERAETTDPNPLFADDFLPCSLHCEPFIPDMWKTAGLKELEYRRDWYGEGGPGGWQIGIKTPRGEADETYVWSLRGDTKKDSADDFLFLSAFGETRLIIAAMGYSGGFMDDLTAKHPAPVHFLLINDRPRFVAVERATDA